MADAKVWHSSRNGARSDSIPHFINDLPKHLDADCSILADDTTVFASGTDSYTTCAGLSEDLSSASRWAMTWGMLFHAEKSENLAISNGNKEQLSSPISAWLKMVDAELPVVERHRHLGLIINKALSWEDQCILTRYLLLVRESLACRTDLCTFLTTTALVEST